MPPLVNIDTQLSIRLDIHAESSVSARWKLHTDEMESGKKYMLKC